MADDAYLINAGSATIDGEVVVPAADGTTNFSVLHNELRGKSTRLVMIAFDLLYLNGQDLRKLPLFERKAHLKKLIEKTAIQFSESFEVDGKEMFAHACKVGLEGVVSKVRDSRYPSGRGRDWVKKTCAQRETLTIAGFALDGNDWDGIYVGRRKGDDLIYAGKVDHGFDKKSSAELRKRLTPLIRKTQPYTKRIAHKGIWVEPELSAEIEYRAKSDEGKVRHPFFRGLREDLLWTILTASGDGRTSRSTAGRLSRPTFITRSRRYRPKRGATAPRSMRPCHSTRDRRRKYRATPAISR